MRYIYYIILIILALSGALGYELLSSPVPPKDTAMIINGQVITVEEFNRLSSPPPLSVKAPGDSINSLITRELLIQEAQREGIDRDDAFRQSIQNFYEQSLIKLLLDRKFNSLKVSVSDNELNRYMSLLGRKVRMTVFTSKTMKDAEKGHYRDSRTREVDFDELSTYVKSQVSRLEVGQKTAPVGQGGEFIVLRLDKLEGAPRPLPSEKDREDIRKVLIGEKREQMISEWLNSLREKASVKVMLKQENQPAGDIGDTTIK